jgi:hypothetical protein
MPVGLPLRASSQGREQAKAIKLGDGEWRSDLDFKLLSNSTTP